MIYNLSEKIAERKTKEVYKDNGKTIKLFVENYSKADILNEALNQARVEESTDLYVAKLLEVTKIENRWALVSEHIEGTTLDVLMEQNPDKFDEYLNKFVEIQQTIHTKQVPLLNRIKEKYKRKINEVETLSDNTKYELLQRLEGMKNHTKLCHGDFNPSNIIIDKDGGYHIIDWSHATQGNASADVARTYLLFTIDGKKDVAEKYLDLFAQKSGIEKSYIQRWIPIVAAALISKAKPEEAAFLHEWADVIEFQ
ncbi:MAG: phosphotransferase [Clostridia bacterium]|nr:phosphotransferase [Clostridia bacterium]